MSKHTRSRLTRSLLALLISVFALGVPTLPVHAHSELLQSTPADGEQLSEAPTEVELVFGEGVQQQGGTIVVKGPDGSRYDRVATFETDENVATVQLSAATDPGEYAVTYRVVSADGHVVSGGFTYEVTDADTAPSAATSASTTVAPLATTETDEGSGGFVWVLGLAAIGFVLLAAVISVVVRGRRDRRG